MNVRLLWIALITALLLGAPPSPASAQTAALGYTVPVVGAVQDFVGQPGVFVGTLRITSFEREGDGLIAKGEIDGSISDGGRSTIGNIRREIALPVIDITGSCDGLRLTFAPLGPEVSNYLIILDPITLDSRGLPGASKLLGNLFCTVGRQLEHNAPPAALAALLNQVLRALS